MQPLLTLENLCVTSNDKKLLNNINLQIYENEILGILGQNGAGKSTLANAIMGLTGYESSGKIIFKGEDIINLSISERAKRGITLAWQEPARFEGLTVNEYLSLSSKNSHPDCYKSFLSLFGLDPSLYLDRIIDSTMSGGERKRIELASAFAMQPELLILDEPDSGIDYHGIISIQSLFAKRQLYAKSIIIITHQQEIAELSDRVALICNGHLETVGEKSEVLTYFQHCYTCPERIK